MNRSLLGHPLRLLLSGLMLTACGAPTDSELSPAEAPAPAEELGVKESASCTGSSVSGLAISGFSSWGGEAAGAGTWSVTYPANAVHLDFSIDGVVSGQAELQGDVNRAGNWNFSYKPVSCGVQHTFKVRAYPMTISSNGEKFWCPGSGPQERTWTFSEPCPTSTFSCSRSSNTHMTCTGTASGGTGGPYDALWYEYEQHDSGLVSNYGWYQGPLSKSFYCPLVLYPYLPATGTMSIYFVARDANGLQAAMQSRTFSCRF
ncbi:MAG TPA: hypothetical protein VFZ09_10655 [Archangium sp.]|uniref:hypothetical protein n=1 Tax=Archangium sp. TaxID=1872627 RepID=UPI002E34C5CE|nr:hypothetical protein [Archangium sp.]HEX5746698.1 hypothetical protein [Archangium sp.]